MNLLRENNAMYQTEDGSWHFKQPAITVNKFIVPQSLAELPESRREKPTK